MKPNNIAIYGIEKRIREERHDRRNALVAYGALVDKNTAYAIQVLRLIRVHDDIIIVLERNLGQAKEEET